MDILPKCISTYSLPFYYGLTPHAHTERHGRGRQSQSWYKSSLFELKRCVVPAVTQLRSDGYGGAMTQFVYEYSMLYHLSQRTNTRARGNGTPCARAARENCFVRNGHDLVQYTF